MKINENLLRYIVIPDTNILWYKDKSVVVNPDFDKFWDEYAQSYNLDLCIPEVVKGELLFQQSTSAIKSLNQATTCFDEINKITEKKYDHKITEEEIKTLVEQRFDKWLKSKNARLIKTPMDNINWKSLIANAIWRKPPFEYNAKNEKHEKGFRDSLILETVLHFFRNEPTDHPIIFICNDFLLRTAAGSMLKTHERFLMFESVKDFQSHLNLISKQLTTKFIQKIIKKAAEKFYKEDSQQGLFYEEDIPQKLYELYPLYYETPQHAVGYTPTERWRTNDNGKYWVGAPQFQSLENKKEYHWLNEVIFVRQYWNLPSFFEFGETILTIDIKLLLLQFNIFWKAKITKDGRFYNLEVQNFELKHNEFRTPTIEDIKKYKLTNLEQLTQDSD